jgi:flagellar basal-body rod modification protein FlgD
MTTSVTKTSGTALSTAGTTAASSSGASDPFANVDLKSFIDLMIAELQNQDPLNPMDNSQILQELGQLRSIDSTDKLIDTLGSVLQGQNFASASSLIGKTINGLDDNAQQVSGTVDKVSVAGTDVKLHVGDATVSLKNVSDILPTASS